LKNAVCCLKCRKVGVDAVRKKMPGLSRGYDRCKICKSYAYRYIEITTSPIIFVVLTVMVIWVMPVSEDGSRPIVVIGIWISIMCGVYLNNLSKRKKIRRLLEEHMRKDILDGEQS
ncbi:hypothetical protein N9B32_04840, partial [Akkermansiaceae bacterium]|nr:hypothetical protein [Akkermansiaceae bacterium]